jgi:hypothetical protein
MTEEDLKKLKDECLTFRLEGLKLSRENKKLKEINDFLTLSHSNIEKAWLREVEKNAELTKLIQIDQLEREAKSE